MFVSFLKCLILIRRIPSPEKIYTKIVITGKIMVAQAIFVGAFNGW